MNRNRQHQREEGRPDHAGEGFHCGDHDDPAGEPQQHNHRPESAQPARRDQSADLIAILRSRHGTAATAAQRPPSAIQLRLRLSVAIEDRFGNLRIWGRVDGWFGRPHCRPTALGRVQRAIFRARLRNLGYRADRHGITVTVIEDHPDAVTVLVRTSRRATGSRSGRPSNSRMNSWA